ncbi:MAG: PKD domain-containing protein [Saprospiraceae bacterium]
MKLKGFKLNIIVFICFFNGLFGQSINLSKIEPSSNSPLNQVFYDYKLVKIDFNQLKSAMSTRGTQHFLNLKSEGLDWQLELFDNDIYAPNYLLQVGTEDGVKQFRRKPAIHSLIGYLKTQRGGEARITIADNFIAGMVSEGGANFFIEPANGIDPKLPSDYLVIYNSENIFRNTNIECGYDAYIKNKQQFLEQGKVLESKEIETNKRAACLQVEIAIANDFSVFQKRGSVNNVESWNNTILTLLQANYDNEFANSLEFVQTASFVASSSGSDPWLGINNINSHLDKHVSWGNSGGYGAGYDVATAWTTKYTNGAVGLAWLGVICNNLRYNVCSDYGGSNSCLRQLQAHELGHNFNANHDGSGQPFIMAPAVNCTSTWSSGSISAINNHVASRGCLTVCSSGSAPEADFFGTPTEACVPFTVQFTDLSTNDPTAWQWTFPGGTPSTSTAKNPIIQYKAYGNFDVTLKVTNPFGNNTITFTKYINANEKPVASFSKVVIERNIYLTNTTKYGDIYEWDFGDGETSNDVNPNHEYLDDGIYEIILRAENDCGVHEVKMKVTIVTTPLALFVADTTSGCATLKVKYTNLSSKNVTSWEWSFPGGTPSTSSLFEPTVEYKTAGSFDVRLIAKNSKYKATVERLKYINVDSIPLAAFTSIVNNNIVSFTNNSKYANTWSWDFGDGTTSVENNPTHTYNPGNYLAKLITQNKCGVDTSFETIVIGSGLTVGFSVNQTKGCIPFSVQYSNNSAGATAYSWSFPGGNPSTSTDLNPVVTYNTVGIYDATLIASNASDSKSITKTAFIEIGDIPKSDFKTSITGSTVYFTDQSIYGNTYFWDFGDNTTSPEASPIHLYNGEGEYQVRLIVTNSCGADTLNKIIAVYLIPKIDFTADTTILCGAGIVNFKSKTSSDVNFWSWQFDGGSPDISDLKDPVVRYNGKGIYAVKLTVKNSNGENTLIKQSFIKVISPVLCPENIFYYTDVLNGDYLNPVRKSTDQEFLVFPNPTSGTISVLTKSFGPQTEINIVDMLGKLVYKELFEPNSGSFRKDLNLEYLPNGSYYLSIKDQEHSLTKAIFISK